MYPLGVLSAEPCDYLHIARPHYLNGGLHLDTCGVAVVEIGRIGRQQNKNINSSLILGLNTAVLNAAIFFQILPPYVWSQEAARIKQPGMKIPKKNTR